MYIFGNGRAVHVEGCSLLKAARRRGTVVHEVSRCPNVSTQELLGMPQGTEVLMQRRMLHCYYVKRNEEKFRTFADAFACAVYQRIVHLGYSFASLSPSR